MAELLSYEDEDALLERSRTRLRRVPLGNIKVELLSNKTKATHEEVLELSEPCEMHEIDYFIV